MFLGRYTATNGREFLAGLALKEQRNPQYDFLKPTHMLFGYFTTLVDAYARILNPASKNLVRIPFYYDGLCVLFLRC